MQFPLPLITFLLCAAAVAAAQTGPVSHLTSPSAITTRQTDLQVIVSRLENAQRENHAHMVPYTESREYELFSDSELLPKATVVASVHFRPPDIKTWKIERSTGSGRGEKVVKSLLERETRFAKDGKIGISRQDYDFQYAGTADYEHRPCYVLQLVPKREDSDLLRGKIWVDRDTYLIHHFQGAPAKNPSWWVKDMNLAMNYSDQGGMWLVTSSKGEADIRLFGQHRMTERTLNYQAERRVTAGPVADLARLRQTEPPHSYRTSPIPAVGVGIIPGR